MNITNFTEQDLVETLTKGLLEGVRKQLKQQLMGVLEKEVDTAVENVIRRMTGYVHAQRDFAQDRLVFNITINGVSKQPTSKDSQS
jgi:hypothetical protein